MKRWLTILAAVLCTPGILCADMLVDSLAAYQQNRGMMGEMSVVRFTSIKQVGNAPNFRYTGKLDVLMPLDRGEPAKKPESYQVQFYRGSKPPLNKPVVVFMRVLQKDNAYLMPFQLHRSRRHAGQNNQVYFLDRGDPSSRYFKLTREVLFPDKDTFDEKTFYKTLVELTRDDDPRVVELATSYIGSPINVYARADCPDEAIDAFSKLILEQTDAGHLQDLTSFFNHAPLPTDGALVIKLLGITDPQAAAAITSALARSGDRAESLSTVLVPALAAPDRPELRLRLLKSLRSWSAKAAPLWDVVNDLTLGKPALQATTEQRGLAAQLLVAIDAERARTSVHKALVDLDDPAVYRFVYTQRMVDTVGVLVDKLRKRTTSHDALVCALLAALVRKAEVGTPQDWVTWWDQLVEAGQAQPMIARKFIDEKTQSRVRQLVAGLGHAQWSQRQQAIMALHEVGPVADPLLEQALENDDFEVRVAAEQLLEANRRRMQAVLQKLGVTGGQHPMQFPPNMPIEMQMMLRQKMMVEQGIAPR